MKVKRLKELMVQAKIEHQNTIKETQKLIMIDPMKNYHLSVKIAGLLNQISNIESVIQVCETLNPQDSILSQ